MSETTRRIDPSIEALRQGKHVHHGKTPAAWAGSMIALAAFFVGGIGLVLGPNWVVFGVGVAMLVLALVVTRVLQVTGHGASSRRSR
ncbi:hypothetical protein FHX74_002826 [Friedmanniella endophytica]|uniref:Uncharacterized protein n=1 Tax=Microlunatus kandeliicorticis TaxID=1759536 RepID=A0A7W3IU10_9ACTN|nr:HGxxPAAW family protein [Microlunatus kandeliicorticis]MBA8795198.1 hypothetical protein [Microlunatus kandeliicorticis]